MEFYNEKVVYENPLLSIKVFQSLRNNDLFINWHYHREIELLLVITGELDVNIEDECIKLQTGDIALIGARQLHRDRSMSSPLNYIVLQFDLEQFIDQSSMPYMRFFSETKNPLSRANYIFQENESARAEASECIRGVLQEVTTKQSGYELAVSMYIKKLLLLLIRGDSRKVLADHDDFDRARLRGVIDYVEEHLTDRIQVEEVSKLANMSYYYFVKFFKKAIGMSFTEYVNYRKIKWAERILLTKDLSVSEVGDRIGMPNMAHFYKMFKKYNDCSPKQFQKKMLEWNRA
ncbi:MULTISPECIES: AraC family transcriptional regulator [Paenibacillus]|uniref:Helix-turn-helix transcriptional regulator n=1 Tax=Paenibacillus lignilyticus TaxID=1172615 RepID=A0ABS5CBV0_9BACL|nr:AraC family transcriptional regulator [Paenibacillus sp. BC26]MBP3961872.1 helix-turn-helix transcriptional regulator [Paenibacillus lignilyticus]MBP3963457.1 helix-turn-helix transcriptional regulator [Paenibacillus lignilyticus]SFS53653.1 AraC-type DNA-binding protein [Paenibacillus sp. BC26]